MSSPVDYNSVPEAFGPLLGLSEHWDELVVSSWEDDKYSASMFADHFPEQPFPNNKGAYQQYGVWRKGKTSVLGIADWQSIVTSQAPSGTDPGVNACQEYSAKQLTFGGNEIFRNEGGQLLLESPPICVKDLRFQDEAQMQISLRVNHLIAQTMEYRSVWGQSQFIKSVMMADHGYIMTPGGSNPSIGATVSSSPKWYTDVAVQDSNEDYHLYYPEGVEISTINWDILKRQTRYLTAQCANAAMSNIGGRPVFLAYGDSEDLMNAILADDAVREDFRNSAKADLLIGDFRAFDEFRGLAIGHDPGQWRYKPVGVVASTGSNISNGRGGYLSSGNWVKCVRVDPERFGRTILDGAQVVEANPEYFDAPLRLLPIVMKNVLIKQVGTPFTNLDSRMSFGPTPGMNGELMFLAIQHPERNPFREIGNFFSRFEYWRKPAQHYMNTVCYLYAACKKEDIKRCDSATSTTTAVNLATAVAAADVTYVSDVVATIEVRLDEALKAATGGTKVTLTDKDGSANSTNEVYILDASNAPNYVLGITDITDYGLSADAAAATVAAEFTTAATVAIA